jgi:hypothetical protein
MRGWLVAVMVLIEEFDGTFRPWLPAVRARIHEMECAVPLWLAAVLFANDETGRAVFGCLPSGHESDCSRRL